MSAASSWDECNATPEWLQQAIADTEKHAQVTAIGAALDISPEAASIVHAIQSGDCCDHCFAPHYQDHFDLCPYHSEFTDSAVVALNEYRAEVERLRSYKSLPEGMVWQDYYSPDDVCKIREPLDDEIAALRSDLAKSEEALAAALLKVSELEADIVDRQVLDQEFGRAIVARRML